MMLVKNSRNPDNPYRLAKECQIETLDDIYYQYFGNKTDGFFIEVGAFDGYNWSNTYGLAQMGWSGILVEPQEEYANKCRALYSNNPNIYVVECACGAFCGDVDLYFGGSLSTTKAQVVDIYNSMEWSMIAGLDLARMITVEQRTLDFILGGIRFIIHPSLPLPRIDLLVIDVEGAELDVLRGLSMDLYAPRMFIIETHENYPDERLNRKAKVINRYLRNLGYTKIHADTINSIYWRE